MPFAVAKVERDVRHVQRIVGEILLDDVTFVAEADNKLVDSEVPVDLHDVPQDRMVSNLDHRLGPVACFLAEPASQPASKNDGFHDAHSGVNADRAPRRHGGAGS